MNQLIFISTSTIFYRSIKPLNIIRAKTLSKSSQITSKLPIFSNRYIGKRPYEEINLLKPVSLNRNSKTKRHLQIPNRIKNVLTILKVIRLRNVIFSTNGYTLKIEKFKKNMPKVSSKFSKPMRLLKNGTALFIKS